jgi:hypothetical protein
MTINGHIEDRPAWNISRRPVEKHVTDMEASSRQQGEGVVGSATDVKEVSNRTEELWDVVFTKPTFPRKEQDPK